MSNPKVMVALRDAESVESLVKLACQMSEGMKADLVALHVVEIGPGLPLDVDDEIFDRPGKQVLSRAHRVATESFSRPMATRLVHARRAGEAIVGEVKDQSVDLLVMGYHQKHGPGEALLGSTVQYVAGHTPCRVVVQIPPLNGDRGRA